MSFFRDSEPPAAIQPGTLQVVPGAMRTRVSLLSYGPNEASERSVSDIKQLSLGKGGLHWISVQGLAEVDWVRDICAFLGAGPEVVEALTSSGERPKTEWLDAGAMVVLRAPYRGEQGRYEIEQIGVFVGENFVLTVQESHSDALTRAWSRILQGHERNRRENVWQLAYLVIDAAVDSFYPTLEDLGDRLEELEGRVMESVDDAILTEANRIRTTLVNLRRAVWPQREAIQALTRNDRGVLDAAVERDLRGVYDHSMQISEMIESYRDLVGSINGTYLSAVSHRTNEVMSVLTIMASVFIPLTFVAGIYGMNFEYMPELSFRYGYGMVWVVMITIAVGMLVYFRKKDWV